MTSKDKDNQKIIGIQLNHKPIIHKNFYYCLTLELILAVYYCFLAIFGISTDNLRIMIYCCLFVVNQFTKIADSLLNSVDPLSMTMSRKCLNLLGWACKINMVYLLCVLLFIYQPLPVLLILVHFCVANFPRTRPQPSLVQRKGRNFYKIIDFINPILIYSFLKEFDSQKSDLSLVFLLFLCGNLVCISQLRLILAHAQCDILGWSGINQDLKDFKLTWNRQYGFKFIMIICCVLLFIQNACLFIDSIKNQIFLNIVQTLIIGFTTYILSRGSSGF